MTIILVLTHVGAFVLGALVFRNNKDKAEAVIASTEATVTSVEDKAKDIAAKV